jgi:prefoldin subunit 5
MPTLRIDDRDYEIDDLPEETRAKVGRMQEINAQIRSLNLQINELQTVFQAYVNTVKDEVNGDQRQQQSDDPAEESS